MSRCRILLSAIAASLTLAVVAAVPAAAQVPVPDVQGPIAATATPGDPSRNYPFFASDDGLARDGYVEEEFFISGTATNYVVNGTSTATVGDPAGAPYKTRVVVRRPARAAKFNGTVVVEWYNVSNQYDQEVDWLQSHEHFVREGYAWVGVSAQRAGVHSATGLRAWNPARYGSLDLTAGGTLNGDQLSYDVFSQAGQAVWDGAILNDFRVRQVLATGHSQSAMRLRNYYNSVHPLANVYDGFVMHGLVGPGTVRTDIPTPVFKLQSESDVLLLGQAASRQPDNPYLRTWEVAGTTHGDWKLIIEHGPLRFRDLGTYPDDYPGRPPSGCAAPPFSRIPWYMVQNRAYDWLRDWAMKGKQPPSAPLIELSSTQPAVAVRDEFGNALGGLRLPQFEVPVARDTGLNSGPGFCFLHGAHVRFDRATIDALYPRFTDYVKAIFRETARAQSAGYIDPADAAAIRRHALRNGPVPMEPLF